MSKILLVEDDQQLSKLVRDWLKLEHHSVEVLSDGLEAEEHLKVFEYDLIILDWQLPNRTGIEILKSIRLAGQSTPVLMLTGRGTVDDKEAGFGAGADDYLPKPFHGKELTLRVGALLRRPAGFLGDTLTCGWVKLERTNYKVTCNDEEVRLLPKEFALLEFLMRNPNRVFAPEALLNRVWATDSEASNEALTSCIKRLRKKIDVDGQPSIITTVHGVGYRLGGPTP